MYQELIARLGELGFGVKEDEDKKVAKYDQYTGELLPGKIKEVNLINNRCNIAFKEDDFYNKCDYIYIIDSKHSKPAGYMTITNPNNYPIEYIYEMAKQMLDKVMEYNNG